MVYRYDYTFDSKRAASLSASFPVFLASHFREAASMVGCSIITDDTEERS